MQLVGGGVASIDLGFPMRYSHSSLEVCDLGDLEQLTQLLVAGDLGDRRRHSASTATTTSMSHYLGIDIGTFESKGVIVDERGQDRRQRLEAAQDAGAAAGLGRAPAEAGLVGRLQLHLPRKCWRRARIDPKSIRAVGASAIGPCMLPVDADGEALSNAALYGVDTRAAREIEELNAAIGADRILDRCGNALTSQSVGPKILWLKKNRPDIFAKAAKIVTSTTYLVQKLTGECVIDHYSAANFSPLYVIDKQGWSTRARARHHRDSTGCRKCCGRPTSPAR